MNRISCVLKVYLHVNINHYSKSYDRGNIIYLTMYLLCLVGSKWESKGSSWYMHLLESNVFFLSLSLLALVNWAIIAAMIQSSESKYVFSFKIKLKYFLMSVGWYLSCPGLKRNCETFQERRQAAGPLGLGLIYMHRIIYLYLWCCLTKYKYNVWFITYFFNCGKKFKCISLVFAATLIWNTFE